VDRKGESASAVAPYDPSNPKLRRPDQVSDFFAQVGKNSNYLIYLGEILADNFEFVMRPATVLKQAAKAR
jgi:hypothetical protein